MSATKPNLAPLSKKEKAAAAAAKAAAISESSNFPYLGQALRLTLKDGRLLDGFLAVVDGRGNMILVEAAETRNYKIVDEQGKEQSVESVVKSIGYVSVNIRDVTELKKIVFPDDEEKKKEADTK
eukprot:GILI01019405.1.p1 GENE.GILI01019405.1~~GILI01019405.1.p1  ORF type:complete len:125 (+),score=49.15 GILI01019405.1:75-449(+)